MPHLKYPTCSFETVGLLALKIRRPRRHRHAKRGPGGDADRAFQPGGKPSITFLQGCTIRDQNRQGAITRWSAGPLHINRPG